MQRGADERRALSGVYLSKGLVIWFPHTPALHSPCRAGARFACTSRALAIPVSLDSSGSGGPLDSEFVRAPSAKRNQCTIDATTCRDPPTATDNPTVCLPPSQLRKLLFSATLTRNPKKLARLNLHNPLFLGVGVKPENTRRGAQSGAESTSEATGDAVETNAGADSE